MIPKSSCGLSKILLIRYDNIFLLIVDLDDLVYAHVLTLLFLNLHCRLLSRVIFLVNIFDLQGLLLIRATLNIANHLRFVS